MLNEIQTIELFDKYHLGTANADEKVQVEQMIENSTNLAEVFQFRKILIKAVQENKKEELRERFKVLAREVDEEEVRNGRVIPARWVWAAAAATIAIVLGILYFRSDAPISDKIANNPDSLNVAPKDTATQEVAPPQPQLAEEKAPAKAQSKTLRGVVELPYFESANGTLGFGSNDRPTDRVIAVFKQSDKAGYEYGDTLKVFLTELPVDNGAWKVVYDKSTDAYHLTNGEREFTLYRDRGYMPLN
ncbi:MAG: hypothetical protein ACO1N1_17475 [Dyadobacter fermentans]